MELIIIQGSDLQQYVKQAVIEALQHTNKLQDESCHMPSNDLLTIAETVKRLRISKTTFYKLIKQRKIDTVSISNRRFVTEESLNSFLKKTGNNEKI